VESRIGTEADPYSTYRMIGTSAQSASCAPPVGTALCGVPGMLARIIHQPAAKRWKPVAGDQ